MSGGEGGRMHKHGAWKEAVVKRQRSRAGGLVRWSQNAVWRVSAGIALIAIWVVLSAVGTSAQVSLTNWRSVGPGGGGGLACSAFDPFDEDIVYVGCDVGGPFISTDFGESWYSGMQNLQDWEEVPGSVYSCFGHICPSPHIPGLVFASCRGILRGTNCGRTGEAWEYLSLDDLLVVGTPVDEWYTGAFCFAFHPTDPNVVLAGRSIEHTATHGPPNQHILRSTDYGQTWPYHVTLFPDSNIAVFSIVWDPSPGFSSYVYASTSAGIFRSTDGGDTWQEVGCPWSLPKSCIRLLTAGTIAGGTWLYLTATTHTPIYEPWVGELNRVYRSSDRGWTWTVILDWDHDEDDPQDYLYWIKCPTSNPNTLFAGRFGPHQHALFRCSNAIVPPPFPVWECVADRDEDFPYPNWASIGLGFACTHLAMRENPDRMVFGGASVYKTPHWASSSPAWFDATSVELGQGQCLYRGKGLEPTCISDVEMLPYDPSWTPVAWVGAHDVRVWAGMCPGVSTYWELVHDPEIRSGTEWENPWGSTYGVDCLSVKHNPTDREVVYATASDHPCKWDGFQGKGAVLYTDQWGSGNVGWTAVGDPSVFHLPDAGVAPRIDIDWDRGRIHAAVHGKGYFRGQPLAPNTVWAQKHYHQDFEDSCFAIDAFVRGPDIELASTAMAVADGQRDIGPGGPPRLGRVLIGHSSYKGRDASGIMVGGIWISRDGGNTWHQTNYLSGDMDYLDVLCIEAQPVAQTNYVLAGCWDQGRGSAYGGIVRSTDAGENWEKVLDARRVEAIAWDPYVPGLAYAGASQSAGGADQNAGIHVTTDYGANWAPIYPSGGGHQGMGSLEISALGVGKNSPSSKYLLAGTDGAGLWLADIGGSYDLAGGKRYAGAPDPEVCALRITAPVGGESRRIRFGLDGADGSLPVTLRVYALNGRLVDVLVDEPLVPGSYEVSWPRGGSSIPPSGVYICKLQTPHEARSQRMVYVRQ